MSARLAKGVLVPTISVEQKKQIREANDIIDLVASYIPVQPAGKVYKTLCPFHDDKRPSMQLDRHYQNYRCWSCGAAGDAFDFVMNFEKVKFPEALRILADRAGIKLEKEQYDPQAESRSRMIDIMLWAEQKYRDALLNDDAAEQARIYLGQRRLKGATVQQFGLGYASDRGDWLVRLAQVDGVPTDLLVEVGLIAARDENRGFYDRFRDRIMFPIRDMRGRTVGFGGRILPTSPMAARSPKYYNSAETPLFAKSDLLYGLDLARHAGATEGYLAVVEGYTDVMMAHQAGLTNVVATMGTALNGRHASQLRRYAEKVVLVFDADAGGLTGVDRALELFISQDVELAVATLPEGLDPCDLLSQADGPERFRTILATASDALEFKLKHLLTRESIQSIEGQRRVADGILGIMALAPAVPSQHLRLKQELMVTRLAHRLGIRQETVWGRLGELKNARAKATPRVAAAKPSQPAAPTASGPAQRAERQLLEILLAEPMLVSTAKSKLNLELITHSGLQRILKEMYTLLDRGQMPDLDALRIQLIDRPDLVDAALRLQYVGRQTDDRTKYLNEVFDYFTRQHSDRHRQMAKAQLTHDGLDEQQRLDLLRQIQTKNVTTPSAN